MDALIKWLDVWFGQKAPAIPQKGREIIVKIAPWLVLVSLVMMLPGVFAMLGISARIGSMLPGYAYGYDFGYDFGLFSILVIGSMVLEALALPGLFKRKRSGWMFIFYATLVSLVSYLLMMNVGSLIISGAISFYLLFQVRSYYNAA